MKEFKRITFASNRMGGQACIRGMRIPVSLVVSLVANGMTPDEIIKEYPDIESEDINVYVFTKQNEGDYVWRH